EARANLALRERLEVLRLLLVAAVLVKDLEVAGIRRLATEHVVAERRAPEPFAHEAVLDQAETESAELLRNLRAPQAGGAALRAELAQYTVGRGPAALHDLVLGRDDVLGDELRDLVEQRTYGLGGIEIHFSTPSAWRPAGAR